ncbi:hypothetical protein CL633_01350 [bacterium]|nr:hypothetical protein [bacterium]
MKKVLVIAPHPDDEVIGCGGTIAKVSSENIHVDVAFMVAGWSGVQELDKKQAIAIRQDEAKEAGRILGIKNFYFLEFEDFNFVYSNDAVKAVIKVIRESNPTAIWFPHEADGDFEHKVTHQVTKEACWIASTSCFAELGEPTFNIKQLLCYEVWTPMLRSQLKVDITPFIEQKLKALRCYKSQLASIKYDEAIMGLNRYRGAMSSISKYAEAFQMLRTSFQIPD